jgi:predicted Zn-dependent protease
VVPIGGGGTAGELAARWSANPAAQGAVVPYVRSQLIAGNLPGAASAARRFLDLRPGSADALALIGDVELSQNAPQLAQQHYMLSSRVRFPAQLLPRIALAYGRMGQGGAVQPLLAQYLAMFPRSRTAQRMAASQAALAGDWSEAQALLENLVVRGGAHDWRLLCDLSLAQLRSGDAKAASDSARRAWQLQPAAALTNQAYGMALAEAGGDPEMARQLLESSRRIGGDNPLLVEARKKLK